MLKYITYVIILISASAKADVRDWDSVEKAIRTGNVSQAVFRSSGLDEQDRRLVVLWAALSHNQNADHLIEMELDSPRMLTQQTGPMWKRIGLILARSYDPRAYVWLTYTPPNLVDTNTSEWKIRSCIRQGYWYELIHEISLLPPESQKSLNWQYWWAHAHEQLGDEIEATETYRYLATRRHFYGFLAADRLGLPYNFENESLVVDQHEMNKMEARSDVKKAKKLFRAGKISAARKAWSKVLTTFDSDNYHQFFVAAKVAHSWKWHDRTIFTIGMTEDRDDLELRFPIMHEKLVLSSSTKMKLDPAFAFAIIRKESIFMNDAKSRVGATGLMQLMPATARLVSNQLKIPYKGKRSLTNVDTNIRLGTGYLNQMSTLLDGQLAVVAAAYNAGPHRVAKWRPDVDMDTARWVETIPFEETRDYVIQVMQYVVIYDNMLNNKYTRLSDRIPIVTGKDGTQEKPNNSEWDVSCL